MVRPLRIEFAGAMYHISSRGDRRPRIQEHKPYFSMKHIGLFLLFLLLCPSAHANVYSESLIANNIMIQAGDSTTTRHAEPTNIGSSLSGGNVSLTTTKDDTTIVGSEVTAKEKLALDSAGNINVQAGFNGAMDETHTKGEFWGREFESSESSGDTILNYLTEG